MLIVSRKIGEEIVIAGKVHVRILRTSGNRASLAIQAPSTVSVDRGEIWLAKRNRGAGQGCPEENRADRESHRQALQPSLPPGDDSGMPSLRASVHRLIAANHACDGPEVEFLDDRATDELPSEIRRAALPIVEELLRNACRHSKSPNVLLGLAQDDRCLCVQVRDWGIGFDWESNQKHQRGLKTVRDRVARLGGNVAIDSQRGKGTCVIVALPLSRKMTPKHESTLGPRPK
ncbi:MAG: carbon storage regulator [Thermoguttaceae bacterium]